jgi:hypothetical protein
MGNDEVSLWLRFFILGGGGGLAPSLKRPKKSSIPMPRYTIETKDAKSKAVIRDRPRTSGHRGAEREGGRNPRKTPGVRR